MAAIGLPRAGALCAAFAAGVAASLALNPIVLAMERLFRSGDVGSVYVLHIMLAVLPFSVFWVLTGVVLVLGWRLIVGHSTSRFALATALLHGAVCGSIYVYFLALAFFDPDDFIGSNQEATPWNYSLWTWELYPAFALSGALCGLVAWWVFQKTGRTQLEP